MDSEVTLHVDDENLDTIIDWMSKGRYRIPEFQRDYVWDPSDVTDLFDSVYNSYPIGSLFLWEVSEEKQNFFREERDLGQPAISETGYQVSFVLDGQQRLTSLFVATKGIEFRDYDYGRILFNLDAEEFTLGKPSADHLVRVSDIWDMDRRYDIKSELSSSREKKVDQCVKRLQNYKIPLLEIESDDIDSVIQIFERINQKGRDLDRFDIVNANVWSPEFNLRKRIERDINEKLINKGFGSVDPETVTQTLALVIERSCTTQKQKNLDGNDVTEVWNDVRESFIQSVRYIQKQYNIGRVEFLPYQGLIAVLAYYHYQSKNSTVISEHQDEIDQWFWRVIVSDHWESTRQKKMSDDINLMDDIISGREITFNNPVTVTSDKLIEGNIKRSKSKMRNAFLCILAQKRPRDWDDGTILDLSNNHYSRFDLEKHHIFPNAYLRQQGYSKKERKSLIDITFLPEKINNSIKDKAPHVYFDNIQDSHGESEFSDLMESHLIPVHKESGIWDDNYETFLKERANLFMSEIKDLVGDFSGFEEETTTSPSERVNNTESIVRDLIDRRLTEAEGKSYWNIIPNELAERVENRTGDTDPSINRKRLDYVRINECGRIINLFWSEFESVFPSKDDTEHHLNNLQAYKKELEEDNTVDRYTELDGKLAIQWCRECINSAEEKE